MNRLLLLLLFLFMYTAQTLNLELSLAPGLSVKNAFLYLLFLLLTVQIVVRQQQRLELVSVFGPFALYVAYAICMWLAVVLVLQYPGYSSFRAMIPLKNGPIEDLMILLIFFYALSGTEEPMRLLRHMLWIVIAANVITLLDALRIVDLGLIHLREDGRAGGPFGAANQYAAFMALCLPLTVALFWMEKGYLKALAGAAVIISSLATLLAVSRGGILGLVAGAMLAAFLLRKVVPTQVIVRGGTVILLLAAASVIGLYFAGYMDLMVERFATAEGDAGYATSGRTVVWPLLLRTMLEHPTSLITGFGWWVYQNDLAMGMYRFSPHNTYLHVFYDLGAIGLTLFMVVLVNIVRTVRSAVTSTRAEVEAAPYLIAFIAGFIGVMVAIFFTEIYAPWLYIWAISGVCLRIAVSVLDEARERAVVRPADQRAPFRYPAAAPVPLPRSS